MRLEKHIVCTSCLSVGIIDKDCVCSYALYDSIELEFEVCECCDNLISDGDPADTEFNKEQLSE